MARKGASVFETEREPFPTRLREIMDSTKTTQEMLATYLGVKRQTVSLYKNGQSKPDTDQVSKIAQFFQVSSDWLLGLADVKSPDANIQDICKLTGLSESSIEQIKNWKSVSMNEGGALMRLVNQILSSGSFCMLVYQIQDFQESIIAESVYWNLLERYYSISDAPECDKDKKQRKEEFCKAVEKVVKESGHPRRVKNKILAEHQLWSGGKSFESLRDSLIDVSGFSFADVWEYRANKELSTLLDEIRSEIVANIRDDK